MLKQIDKYEFCAFGSCFVLYLLCKQTKTDVILNTNIDLTNTLVRLAIEVKKKKKKCLNRKFIECPFIKCNLVKYRQQKFSKI